MSGMYTRTLWILLAMTCGSAWEQTPRPKFDSFEVATIKTPREDEKGRYIKMEGTNRFVAVDYTLKLLIAAAYDLNPKTVLGGPGWTESQHFNIEARTPGAVRPTHDEQMAMLRDLLTDRFKLAFHREQKEYSIFAIEVAKGGPKLKATATPDQPPVMGPGVVYPGKITLPARNATIGELASILQRAILDRPVVDQTGLQQRYDFDLSWAPDESQFGGDVPKAPDDAPVLPLFEAMQQQLGLRIDATKGMVAAMVVDGAQRPSDN